MKYGQDGFGGAVRGSRALRKSEVWRETAFLEQVRARLEWCVEEGFRTLQGPRRIREVLGLVLGEELGVELRVKKWLLGLNGSVRGMEYPELRGPVALEDVKGAFQTRV